MKKLLFIISASALLLSCEKKNESKEPKTAYIDTAILMKEYTEAQDLQAKYKAKAEEKGRQLDIEVNRFKKDASNFQREAQLYGQSWAQQKGAELQQREQQLMGSQQALVRQLQEENGVEMDTLINKVKRLIRDYGKKNSYSYIYGTGESASILYAEEKYNITKEIIKLLNDNYKDTVKEEPKKK